MSRLTYLECATAFILLVAGLSKAGPRPVLQPFLIQLGLPRTAAARIGYAVPAVEIGCAAALLAGVRPLSGLAALALAASFLGALLVAVATGVPVGCRCFGPIDTDRVTTVTIARAGVLCGLAAAVLQAQLTTVAAAVTASSLLGGALTAFVYVVGFALLDRVRDFQRRRQALFSPGGEPH